MAGSNSTELPGLIGIVDRLLFEAAACRKEDMCREYVHTCAAGVLLSDALMRLIKSKDKVHVEDLYEAVASQIGNDIVLHSFKPIIDNMLDKTAKYLVTHGDITNNVLTRYDLLKMLAHIEAAMTFLGCWAT
jgi:hypothetical protein